LDLTIRYQYSGRIHLIRCFNFDPFDFLERKFLAGAIVEFSGTWRFVVRDGLGVLERAPISAGK